MNRPTQNEGKAHDCANCPQTLRILLAWLFAVAVCLQASCVPLRPENLAEPDKRSLGRVAILPAQFEPSYQFEGFISGKGEGAAKGALSGVGVCGEAKDPLSLLICLPIGIVAGTIHGAATAVPSAQVEQAKIGAQREIAQLELNKKIVNAAAAYGRAMEIGLIPIVAPFGPASPDASASYSALQGQADSVIEVSVLHVTAKAYSPGSQYLSSSMGVEARVRVISVNGGKVIDSLSIKERSLPRPLEKWLASDGSLIKQWFDETSTSIAETIIDEILLVYVPKETPQQKAEAAEGRQRERVPPYVIRVIEDSEPLASVLPSLRWEAWPRGFDIQPGNGPNSANQVKYDLRIFGPGPFYYERLGLAGQVHQLESPLQPCRSYRWTIRARFLLNNTPRATEWTGEYNAILGPVAPWWWRRTSEVPALAAIPGSPIWYYPTFEIPSLDGRECPSVDNTVMKRIIEGSY